MGTVELAADQLAAARGTRGEQHAERDEQDPAGAWRSNGISGSAEGPERRPGCAGTAMNADAQHPWIFLVRALGTGAVIVQGYPTGESVYVAAADSEALRTALDAALAGSGIALRLPPMVRPRV